MSIKAASLTYFLTREIPIRKNLLGTWLKERMAVLVSGESGIGKSLFIQSIALGMAHGLDVFGWEIIAPLKVGLLDGENDDRELQDRLTKLLAGLGAQDHPSSNLMLLTRGLFSEAGERQPDLLDPIDQAKITAAFSDCDVIFIDNINALADMPDEHHPNSWAEIQRFIFLLRDKGKTVFLIHHTTKGKKKSPAGSSRNVRAVDLSIVLAAVSDCSDRGADFYVECQKNRGSPKGLTKFRTRLAESSANEFIWETFSTEISAQSRENKVAQVLLLHSQKRSIRDIAKETGIGKSTVSNMIKDAL
jgi:hypothetical protein